MDYSYLKRNQFLPTYFKAYAPTPMTSRRMETIARDYTEGWTSSSTSSMTTSPAISALALLGFLFFLNLITNSLNLNRQLLSTTVISTNPGVTAGGAAAPRIISQNQNLPKFGKSLDKKLTSRPIESPESHPRVKLQAGAIPLLQIQSSPFKHLQTKNLKQNVSAKKVKPKRRKASH